MSETHTYHIPVMGLGFTIDTPLNVAHFGIDSVVSLGDDILIEKIRKYHSEKYDLEYQEISDKEKDYRARRITAYLNMLNKLVNRNLEEVKSSTSLSDKKIIKLMDLLPENSPVANELFLLKKDVASGKVVNEAEGIKNVLADFKAGSIDVNIMTKADKQTYINGVEQPTEFNNAHSALRGYALSDLTSSIVFSAGMNPRLYTYLENFKDFYPNELGFIKKKIVLKVSDYRSALIQGKFLAKKGLWINEFRIESGLNCGGHAFATDGLLMGPILEKFKTERSLLINELFEIYSEALVEKGFKNTETPPNLDLTAQGGVGTAQEHQFLLKYYNVKSVGWGSPFLLVPEACRVDKDTRRKLCDAKEDDLYLSNISPFGVPFNNIRGNSKDIEKKKNIDKGRPGSACPKDFLSFDTEFDEKGLCTASRQYQHLKIKQLDENKELSSEELESEREKITEKVCLCVGLGTAALLEHGIEHKKEGEAVSVCPGPNIAYFDKEMTLVELTQHIYGKINIITNKHRPHMFIKELQMYMDVLENKINDYYKRREQKEKRHISKFQSNLGEGISYYSKLFSEKANAFFNIEEFKNSLFEAGIKLKKLSVEFEPSSDTVD